MFLPALTFRNRPGAPVSFCLIFVIGKKFDSATFAANFKIWKKIKKTFQISVLIIV
jgi:hypothetical protein